MEEETGKFFSSTHCSPSIETVTIATYLSWLEPTGPLGKRIVMHPDFQRKGGLWPKVAKQKLIRSISRGYPIPPVYICRSRDQKRLLLDGLQRTTALQEFRAGDYGVPEHFFGQNPNSKATVFFTLKAGPLKDTAVELSETDKKEFDNCMIRLTELTGDLWLDPQYLSFFFQSINFSVDLTLGEKLWNLQHPLLTRVVTSYRRKKGAASPRGGFALEKEGAVRDPLLETLNSLGQSMQSVTGKEDTRYRFVKLLVEVVVYTVRFQDISRPDSLPLACETHKNLSTCEHASATLDALEIDYQNARGRPTERMSTYADRIAQALLSANEIDTMPFYQYRVYLIFWAACSETMRKKAVTPVFAFTRSQKWAAPPKGDFQTEGGNLSCQLDAYVAMMRLACDETFRTRKKVERRHLAERYPTLSVKQVQFLERIRTDGSFGTFNEFMPAGAPDTCSSTRNLPDGVRHSVWKQYVGEKAVRGACAACGCGVGVADFHVAHVHASSRGGGDNIENLRPSCAECYQSMGNRNLQVFKTKFYEAGPEPLTWSGPCTARPL